MKDALDYAFRLLERRDYTVKQIRDKLRFKEYSQDEIKKTISRLLELGYLDDEKYARRWAINTQKYRPRGKLLMSLMLAKKGILKDLREKVLDELIDEKEELKMAQSCVTKKMRSLGKLSKKKKYEKLGRFLESRGFNYAIIAEILEEMIK